MQPIFRRQRGSTIHRGSLSASFSVCSLHFQCTICEHRADEVRPPSWFAPQNSCCDGSVSAGGLSSASLQQLVWKVALCLRQSSFSLLCNSQRAVACNRKCRRGKVYMHGADSDCRSWWGNEVYKNTGDWQGVTHMSKHGHFVTITLWSLSESAFAHSSRTRRRLRSDYLVLKLCYKSKSEDQDTLI